jgi:hypothetical protein
VENAGDGYRLNGISHECKPEENELRVFNRVFGLQRSIVPRNCDSGINLSSVGLLVMSALFFWRGYTEPNSGLSLNNIESSITHD